MIYLENQMTALFSIGDIEDFITPDNIRAFTLYENAGNLRPIIELKFTLQNKKIINYLNPGNILRVSFGISELDKDVIQFKLYGDETNLNYSVGYEVTIKAALYIPQFTSKVNSKCYNGSSLEVIRQIAASARLNLHTNISRTNDTQVWEQIGETDWQFIFEPWLHSYINDQTFTSFGFDCYNMYFYDIRTLVRNGNKWMFTPSGLSSKNSYVVNYGQYFTKNNYGTYAPLIGENLINHTFNLDTSEYSDVSYNLKNFTVIDSNRLNINATECRDYDYFIVDEDMHSNYVKAYNQNVRNNIMYNSFSIYVSTAGQFKKFRLFDTAEFQPNVDDTRLNGTCFITAIAYQFQDSKLCINLTLNKEAPSGIKGTNLISGEQ